MSPDAKRLKVLSLVTMFVGIAVVVVGIVLFTDGFELSDLLALVSGLATMVLGGSGARIASSRAARCGGAHPSSPSDSGPCSLALSAWSVLHQDAV